MADGLQFAKNQLVVVLDHRGLETVRHLLNHPIALLFRRAELRTRNRASLSIRMNDFHAIISANSSRTATACTGLDRIEKGLFEILDVLELLLLLRIFEREVLVHLEDSQKQEQLK